MRAEGKILVTGGAGYIGSHTAVALLQAGYDIAILDDFHNAKPEALERIRLLSGREFAFYEADIRDAPALHRMFSQERISAVVHFAGWKAVGESVKKPLEYYENNVCGTIALLQAMREANCKKMVFSSSATVYGANNPVPYREDCPTSAINPYGSTKVMIERILEDLCASDAEWSVANLRYFNPIGAHESGVLGEEPNDTPNNLFPYILQVAAGRLKKLSVFGNDYDTPDGTGVRDYIHVMDLAEGHIAALRHVLRSSGVQAVNLGTGSGTSVLELVRAFERASGREIPYEIAGRRPGDVASCYADTEKAERLYGWKAKRDIGRMCEDGWRYAKLRYGIE
ncbi:MAG TPA: UDP-glucose 4-epimerase GalE [Feifaniaceae bacterium]|nr:UDP-glucose 4-epimerase GalE [Feifaniaceae bacterium]